MENLRWYLFRNVESMSLSVPGPPQLGNEFHADTHLMEKVYTVPGTTPRKRTIFHLPALDGFNRAIHGFKGVSHWVLELPILIAGVAYNPCFIWLTIVAIYWCFDRPSSSLASHTNSPSSNGPVKGTFFGRQTHNTDVSSVGTSGATHAASNTTPLFGIHDPHTRTQRWFDNVLFGGNHWRYYILSALLTVIATEIVKHFFKATRPSYDWYRQFSSPATARKAQHLLYEVEATKAGGYVQAKDRSPFKIEKNIEMTNNLHETTPMRKLAADGTAASTGKRSIDTLDRSTATATACSRPVDRSGTAGTAGSYSVERSSTTSDSHGGQASFEERSSGNPKTRPVGSAADSNISTTTDSIMSPKSSPKSSPESGTSCSPRSGKATPIHSPKQGFRTFESEDTAFDDYSNGKANTNAFHKVFNGLRNESERSLRAKISHQPYSWTRHFIFPNRFKSHYSFPSGDSSQAGNVAMFLFLFGGYLWGFVMLLPAVQVARMFYVCHWLEDTLIGGLLGMITQYMLYRTIVGP